MTTNTVTIKQWDTPIECRGKTVLSAALAHGVPYPHDCRSGECGRCKTRLLEGDIEHDSYDDAALGMHERDAGLVLACRARPKTDVVLEWLESQTRATNVSALEWATHDVLRLTLTPQGDALDFAPGQYCDLLFPNEANRAYSMASRPAEHDLEFHLRIYPEGRASTYAAQELRVGDAITVTGPLGDAHLQPDHQGPIVAVAGGTGLAPVLSIVREALARDEKRHIELYFGVRAERDVYAEEALATLAAEHANVSTQIVLSSPSAPTDRPVGFVHDIVKCTSSAIEDAKAYVAGPPPMVAATVAVLAGKGIAEHNIHRDAFTPSARNDKGEPKTRKQGLWQRLFGNAGRMRDDLVAQ